MIARVCGVTAWLLVGHLLLVGLYWLLLNVPESNALALAASALLGLLLVCGAGIIDTSALILLKPGTTARQALARGVRLLPVFVLALLVWLAVSWTCGWLRGVHDAHSTQIDAWLIAKFDWTKTAALHRTIVDVLSVIRYVIGISLAVSLVAVAAFESGADVLRLRWIGRAFRPLQLVAIAVAIFGLVWLPWQAAYWLPRQVPDSNLQIAFATVKLAAIAVLAHVGWAIVLWAPQRQTIAPPVSSGLP
jgi:hypothetical protein